MRRFKTHLLLEFKSLTDYQLFMKLTGVLQIWHLNYFEEGKLSWDDVEKTLKPLVEYIVLNSNSQSAKSSAISLYSCARFIGDVVHSIQDDQNAIAETILNKTDVSMISSAYSSIETLYQKMLEELNSENILDKDVPQPAEKS